MFNLIKRALNYATNGLSMVFKFLTPWHMGYIKNIAKVLALSYNQTKVEAEYFLKSSENTHDVMGFDVKRALDEVLRLEVFQHIKKPKIFITNKGLADFESTQSILGGSIVYIPKVCLELIKDVSCNAQEADLILKAVLAHELGHISDSHRWKYLGSEAGYIIGELLFYYALQAACEKSGLWAEQESFINNILQQVVWGIIPIIGKKFDEYEKEYRTKLSYQRELIADEFAAINGLSDYLIYYFSHMVYKEVSGVMIDKNICHPGLRGKFLYNKTLGDISYGSPHDKQSFEKVLREIEIYSKSDTHPSLGARAAHCYEVRKAATQQAHIGWLYDTYDSDDKSHVYEPESEEDDYALTQQLEMNDNTTPVLNTPHKP